MHRAELDRAYDNLAAAPDGAARLGSFAERSAMMRRAYPDFLDIRYGDRPRNLIDLFRCGQKMAPLLAFIHGGYWQRNSKEMFSCVAEGPLSLGFDVALIGYTLAPSIRVTGIVAEVASAISFLRSAGPRFAVAADRLILSGWSAGAHLVAANLHLAGVDAGFCISGLYDLEPCRLGSLNDALHLTVEEVASLSPIRHHPTRPTPLSISHGDRELPEIQRQALDFHAFLAGRGHPVTLVQVAGADHFSILEELAAPQGRLTARLADLLAVL